MVDELASELQQHKESLSSSLQACMSAVEKLSQEVNQHKENIFPSLPLQTSISAIRSNHSSVHERYSGYTLHSTLWFYLCDHGEEMRKQDGKSILTLKTWVHELQGKPSEKGGSSRKIAALVSSRQFPKIMNAITRTRGVKGRKGTSGFIGLCRFDNLAHQTLRSIRLSWKLMHSVP